jgi:hypothetical protein
MPPLISFRDVTFQDFRYDVLITVTTDVPCHLFCRLTLVEPQIHTKPIYRRGVQFSSELRFCFVSYEDNEQQQAGDTLIHTWLKPNWSYCITKWVYFWGYIAGQPSPSTSPFFKHHNSRIYPPDFHVGWETGLLGTAFGTNQVILGNDAPATGAGLLTYLKLYASPHPQNNHFFVATMRKTGVDLWQVRDVYDAYNTTQGWSYYVVNIACGLGDALAIWGFYGGIRAHWSDTEGKRSIYYSSNPLVPGAEIPFPNIGYFDRLGLYADNFSVP